MLKKFQQMEIKLINSEQQLRSLIPNVIGAVEGEVPLLERMGSFLDNAQAWFVATFFGSRTDVFRRLFDEENVELLVLARTATANEAFSRALPMLDVMFTPNGMAVVNTQNLAPASTSRVDRLAAGVIEARDGALEQLLMSLHTLQGWAELPHVQNSIGFTLFQDFEAVKPLRQEGQGRWDSFTALRQEIFAIEELFADRFFSPELMKTLRLKALEHSLTTEQLYVANRIKATVITKLQGKYSPHKTLSTIVDYIRKRPEAFPEWHDSETAALFSPPVFINKKNSTGYFF